METTDDNNGEIYMQYNQNQHALWHNNQNWNPFMRGGYSSQIMNPFIPNQCNMKEDIKTR